MSQPLPDHAVPSAPRLQPEHFDPAAFLRDYWQHKPLLIRDPWAAWSNPLDPDELAGLACESDVESRMVVRSCETWSLEHGPIAEERFGQVGEDPWTLLVQAVDHHVPEVAALIEPFGFLPNWRIEDVMVSYATDGGGVGPHFDNYDVFLVQGLGRRRWRVGKPADESVKLLPHDDLRLLEHFEVTEEWVLEPGDILYLPPNVPHDGVAVGDDCMTYSIGFRAPSRRELISAWCDDLLPGIAEDDRYTDPGLGQQDNRGEISAPALAKLQAMIAEQLLDRDAFAAWFGCYATTPRNSEIDWSPEVPTSLAGVHHALAEGGVLLRNAASRFSFVVQRGDMTLLFVDGTSFECTGAAGDLAQRLCAERRVAVDPGLTDAVAALIQALHSEGSITFETDD